MLDFISVETAQDITHSVIWLHGLGADGHDFEPIVPELGLTQETGVRFIFPHAPTRPITINNGYVMRAWYDILGLDLTARVDEPGVLASEKLIIELIEQEEAKGINSKNIFLAGFSQGGAMALHTGLSYKKPLAGILALSCYLPLPHLIPAAKDSVNKEMAIFIAHGSQDMMVNPQFGQMSYQYLTQLGYHASWQTYPMDHAVCPAEINAIGQWLKNLTAIK